MFAPTSPLPGASTSPPPFRDDGHWDGVLADCVKNVARVRPYERAHLAKLLAGKCLRFYGARLSDRVGAASVTAAPQPTA